MPERLSGPNQPEPTGESLNLSAEQITDAEIFVGRLLDTYFGGVNFDLTTSDNQKLKQEKFRELKTALENGFDYLVSDQKKYIEKNITERLKLHAKIVEPDLATPEPETSAEIPEVKAVTRPRKKTDRELRHEQIEPELTLTLREFLGKLESVFVDKDICQMIEKIIEEKIILIKRNKNFNATLGESQENSTPQTLEDLKILSFTDLKEFVEQTRIGATKKYNFYSKFQSNTGYKWVKFEISLTPVKRNGVDTLMPKIFETTV